MTHEETLKILRLVVEYGAACRDEVRCSRGGHDVDAQRARELQTAYYTEIGDRIAAGGAS